MKRKAVVTESVTYFIEFDVPEGADEDTIEDAAREAWAANPGRDPDDYECDIDVEKVAT